VAFCVAGLTLEALWKQQEQVQHCGSGATRKPSVHRNGSREAM